MGYHPGAEDDGVYLSAVHAAVNPSLYPHDSPFFELQLKTSVFDTWMAKFVHATGMSVASSEFAWQFISVLLMVWAGWTILGHLFEGRTARWGGIAMFSAMLTLPVAGTALYIADQYLHPRNPATALIMFAIARILAGRRWQAVPLLCLAFVLHPLMGAMGVSFCFVLSLVTFEPLHAHIRSWRARVVPQEAEIATPAAALIPFGWIFQKQSASYLTALHGRHCYYLFQWTWYEWLGAVGPLVLFWLAIRFARKQGQLPLARFATAILVYGTFQLLLAVVLLAPFEPVDMSTLEPMRFLQLIYVFMTLVGGAYVGRYLLRNRVWRWAVFVVVAFGGMFVAQRQLFAGTEHIEFPGERSANPWLQAFAWIRKNTPEEAYFAVDPEYMSLPGEDNHGFRGLAERSVLADNVKDPGVVTKAVQLAPIWAEQVQAEKGWSHFQLADFERLKREFGVDWALVRYPATSGLDCPWHNNALAVCRIP